MADNKKNSKMTKTIFGTTEKSNFVLNMKEETVWNLGWKLFLLILILLSIQGICYELTSPILTKLNDMHDSGGVNYLFSSFILALRSQSAMFSICGVLSMIFAFIPLMKSIYEKRHKIPAILLLSFFVFALVSFIQSFDLTGYNTPFYGLDGRDEGVLAYIFYICVFFSGTFLYKKGYEEKIFIALMCFNLVQVVFALLQSLPIGFPSHYYRILSLLLMDTYLPSGLTGSPILFAMLLTMMGAIALMQKNSSNKLLSILSRVVICTNLIFLWKTQCVAGITGIIFLAVMSLILIIRNKEERKPLFILLFIIPCLFGFVWSYFSPTINQTTSLYADSNAVIDNGYGLYDAGIMFQDGVSRLSTAGMYRDDGEFDIYSASSMYKKLWKDALNIISDYPLVGTGEDCYVYAQIHSSVVIAENVNIMDRPYNIALYLAASMGIPAFVLLFALVIYILVGAKKSIKKEKDKNLSTCFVAVLAYLATGFFGMTSLTLTPIFAFLLGMCLCENTQKQK